MLRTLFTIPKSVSGVPLFDALLVAWVVGCAAFHAYRAKRYGWTEETRSFLPFQLLFAGMLFVLPRLSDDPGLAIRGYGVMVLAGIVAGVLLAGRRAQQMGLNPDIILSLAIWVIGAGFVSARLFYIVQHREEYQGASFPAALRAMLNVTGGGLVVYGALIGAGAALAIFVRRHRLPLLALADLVAPSMVLGLALGRIGCFANGCCFGGPCERPWAVQFPFGSPPHVRQVQEGLLPLHGLIFTPDRGKRVIVESVAPGSPAADGGFAPGQQILKVGDEKIVSRDHAIVELLRPVAADEALSVFTDAGPKMLAVSDSRRSSLPIHPTQLYSAIDAFLLCGFLLAWHPFRRRDGEVVALMLLVHSVSRFLLEEIRTDEGGAFGTRWSISQNMSFVFFAIGAGLWIYLRTRPPAIVRGEDWSRGSTAGRLSSI